MRRHWFVLGLVAVVLVARAVADVLGPVPDWTRWVQDLCIVGIFAIGGLTLPATKLGSAAASWRLHLLIQGISLGLIPLLFVGLDPLLAAAGLEPALRQGFLVLACVPTTVTSCVVYTRLAGGNEPLALFNATLGNLLGIFVTPQLLFLVLGRMAAVDALDVVRGLSLLVLLPLVLGQIVRRVAEDRVDRRGALLKTTSSVLLLVVLLLIFLRTFQSGSPLDLRELALVAVLIVAIRWALLGAAWVIAALPALDLAIEDRIAVTLVGTQKTVVLGLPLLTIMFPGHPRLGLLSLPLLVYHPVQLLIDGLLLPAMHRRSHAAVARPAEAG